MVGRCINSPDRGTEVEAPMLPHDTLCACGCGLVTRPSYRFRRGHKQMSFADQVWQQVNKTATCWLWTGRLNPYGYGRIGADYHSIPSTLAHRVVWYLTYGEWPADTIDHLCRVRHCVNPAHLEVVTRGENVRRGGPAVRWKMFAARDHCSAGHPYSEYAYYRKDRPGARECLACHHIRRHRIK